MCRASSDEMRRLAYRVRFEAFCIERQLLSAAAYPGGLELDEFDAQSDIFVALDAAGPVGTVRAIRNGPRSLPVLTLCTVPQRVGPDRTVEVSRLAVLRRARGVDVLRQFALALAEHAEAEGVEYWGARMLGSGLRMLRRLGLPVQQAPGRTELLADGTELVPLLARVAETREAVERWSDCGRALMAGRLECFEEDDSHHEEPGRNGRRQPSSASSRATGGKVNGHGQSRFLSVVEVAAILGVSVHTIYGMISERRLPFRHQKFGRRVLVDRRELDRWAAERSGV